LLAQRLVVENRRGPAATRAEHVAVAEAAARGEAREIAEALASVLEIGHVHVDRIEARARERGGHLDLTVDALIAKNRDLRPRALRDERRCDVVGGIERELRRDAGILVVDAPRALAVGARGIVAKPLHRVARLRPLRHEIRRAPFGAQLARVLETD